MAVKAVIFDMGNVLLRFDPHVFLRAAGVAAEDEELLRREIFRSLEWVQMDRGTLTDEAAAKRMCSRLPQRLWPVVEELVCRWDRPILPVEGMEALVKELKEAGYGIYLLSNASLRQHVYWPRVPGSQYFDGTFISSDYHLVKPQPEIYHAMLKAFGLQAEECVFIDDSPSNIEGADFCGLPGIVFHGDAALLRQSLRDMGVKVGP